jgi:hypothetical protein
MAALPGRSWHGIGNKAQRLHLKRDMQRRRSSIHSLWTVNEDNKLKNDYENGTPVSIIAAELGRSTNAIQARVGKMKLKRNNPLMNASEVKVPTAFQSSSPSRGEETKRRG